MSDVCPLVDEKLATFFTLVRISVPLEMIVQPSMVLVGCATKVALEQLGLCCFCRISAEINRERLVFLNGGN